MSLSPLQQVARKALLKNKQRLPKFNKYVVGKSAQRMAERELSRLLNDLTKRLKIQVEQYLKSRMDSNISADLRRLLRPTTELYQRKMVSSAQSIFAEANREQVKAAQREVSPLGLDVVGNEPWLKKAIDDSSKEYTKLITRMVRDTELRIAQIATEALEKGSPRGWVSKQIQAVSGISKRRAKIIARDQVGKLQGSLHGRRMQDLGIDSYIWRDSRDKRVAGNPGGLYPVVDEESNFHGNHWERNGRRFLWKKSGSKLVEVLSDGSTQVTEYIDGHPGEPGLCRCFAEPFMEDLVDLQGLERKAKVAT